MRLFSKRFLRKMGPEIHTSQALKGILVAAVSMFLVGCATTHTYDFLVTNGDCNCSKYTVRDKENRITYEFTATYSLDNSMLTTITMKVVNGSRKVLSFDLARVRVSSERFEYQYNNKFVPFNPLKINPGEENEIVLVGQAEVKEADEWLRIAGEKMVVTIRGIRLGDKEVQIEDPQFVPVNPKLPQG
jgi:hypothetical protein